MDQNAMDNARRKINEIDEKMAKLFEARMEAAKTIAGFKKERGLPVYDPERENALIEKNSELIEDDRTRAYYIRFLMNEMALSKQFQESIIRGSKVAYAGIEGAFANIAAKRIFPHARVESYGSFKAAYTATERGECDCCVLPIENSYAGEVGAVMDLMFSGDLFVNGIYTLKISHQLLGVAGAKLSDVKTVISHPQALAQCEDYLKQHGFAVQQAENTAIAAKTVFEQNDPSVAAIASRETAALYSLEVLDHDINESDVNSTRFAVFSRLSAKAARDSRFLLMFSVKNEAGALAKAISVISGYGFNMKVLRSRPVKNEAWQYYFFIEAEGDETSEDGKKMLEELNDHCTKLKIVGHCGDEVLLKKDGE